VRIADIAVIAGDRKNKTIYRKGRRGRKEIGVVDWDNPTPNWDTLG
jgi:hypothetical protein